VVVRGEGICFDTPLLSIAAAIAIVVMRASCECICLLRWLLP